MFLRKINVIWGSDTLFQSVSLKFEFDLYIRLHTNGNGARIQYTKVQHVYFYIIIYTHSVYYVFNMIIITYTLTSPYP
jgi:hypothetical protein